MLLTIDPFVLEKLAGGDAEDVDHRLKHLRAVRLEVAPIPLQPVGRGERDTATATGRQPIGVDALLGEQLGDSQSHVHTQQDSTTNGNKSISVHIPHWTIAMPAYILIDNYSGCF